MMKPVYTIVGGFMALQASLLVCCAVGFGVDSWPAFVATGAIDIIDLGVDWYLWRHFGFDHNAASVVAASVASGRAPRTAIAIGAVIESFVVIFAPLIGMALFYNP